MAGSDGRKESVESFLSSCTHLLDWNHPRTYRLHTHC